MGKRLGFQGRRPRPDVQWVIWRSQFYILLFMFFTSGVVCGLAAGIALFVRFS